MSDSTSSPSLPDRITQLAFVIFVIASGGASVAIRFTYADLPPFWGGTMRFVFGAIFFWAVVLLRRLELPRGRALTGAILFGVFSMGFPFLFIYWGLVKTPASLNQTIMVLVPLLPIFFAFFHRLEPFRPRGLVGALLTVVGIIVAVDGTGGGNLSLPHVLAIIAGAACFAEAGIITKLFPRNNPYVTKAFAMPVGALILFAGSFLSREKIVPPSQSLTWISFGYIVIFVTIVAFLLYLFVLG